METIEKRTVHIESPVEYALRPRVDASPHGLGRAGLFMLLIPLLLSFVPLFNGLLGGIVGGQRAGTVSRAFKIAWPAALGVAAGQWCLYELVVLSVWDPTWPWFSAACALLSAAGVIIGALVGGWSEENRLTRRVQLGLQAR